MQQRVVFLIPVLFTLSLIPQGCSSDAKPGSKTDTIGESQKPELDSTVRLIPVPGPLQVVTTLRNACPVFEAQWLIKSDSGQKQLSSAYSNAVYLGASLADIGYCVVYNQRQEALDRLKKVQPVMNELGLGSVSGTELINRFKKNENRPDSLSRIVLELYKKSSDFFSDNKREEDGFFITAGSYIESLYLILHNKRFQASEEFPVILGQEKIFLDNLVEALTYLEPNEPTQDMFNTLYSLQQVFGEIKVDVKNREVTAETNAAELNKLRLKTVQLREEILGTGA
ncbi:MAG: hypothetical protein FD123_212 [Bacteroidetes bacterium]|nr:MAG: hypothetical protein FD123_212 [Bacteroidota bacterium]